MATSNSFNFENQAIDIVVVGGDILGLATVLALHRVSLKSLVLERSDTLRATGASFTVWANAWKALDALGVADTFRPDYPQLEGIRGFSKSSSIQKDVQLIKQHTIGGLNAVEAWCIEKHAILETGSLFTYQIQL